MAGFETGIVRVLDIKRAAILEQYHQHRGPVVSANRVTRHFSHHCKRPEPLRHRGEQCCLRKDFSVLVSRLLP